MSLNSVSIMKHHTKNMESLASAFWFVSMVNLYEPIQSQFLKNDFYLYFKPKVNEFIVKHLNIF